MARRRAPDTGGDRPAGGKVPWQEAPGGAFRDRLLVAAIAPCRAQEPFADIHVHFNRDQKEFISAREVVARLRRARVAFAVVTSTPTALALELKQAGGDPIVPCFSPYTHELGRQDWYLDANLVGLAEAGLRDGLYRGIGEVHFMADFKPSIDNPFLLN